MDGTTRYYMAGVQLAGTNSDRRVPHSINSPGTHSYHRSSGLSGGSNFFLLTPPLPLQPSYPVLLLLLAPKRISFLSF